MLQLLFYTNILVTPFRIYMKNATTFILYKIVIGSLWERQLANKLAAFSLDHKPANNMVNLAASQHQHNQNLTNLLTPHFEKLALARGRKSTGSECVLLKSACFLNCPKLWAQAETGWTWYGIIEQGPDFGEVPLPINITIAETACSSNPFKKAHILTFSKTKKNSNRYIYA